MGLAKQEGIRWDGLVSDAQAIAVEAGSIKLCPHETPLDDGDEMLAYDLAHKEFAAGKHTQFKDVAEIDEAMKEAFENSGPECVACRKNYEKD